MNPSDSHSSLAALRQLKEMLDAGTITPAEFEVLKRQIVFGVEPALPLASSNSAEPVAPVFTEPTPLPTPSEAPTNYFFPEKEVASMPTPQPATPSPAEPDWQAAAAPSLLHTQEEEEPLAPEEERRNPLNLIFAIGGLLVFLGVIAYLMLGRSTTPNEHLTSTSQTAADSTATVPEVGPQAEQITLAPAAAPETIRVAPATPPVSARAASQFRTDSVVTPAATPPAAKTPATTPAVAPGTTISTDSAAQTP